MNHTLITEIRVLARTLEHWENVLQESTQTVTPDKVKRWQVGIEADIAEGVAGIAEQFRILTRASKPKTTRTKAPKVVKARITKSKAKVSKAKSKPKRR